MLNNGFPIHTHLPPTPRPPITPSSQRQEKTTQKWAPFTYVGKETTFITNVFKETDIKVTLRANNTLQKLLMPKSQTRDKYNRSGVFKLTCPDCNKAYVGQTGRSFIQRYKEHRSAFRSNKNTSNYAKHALEHSHKFSPIQESMQILQYQDKGAYLNTIEKYYIYKEFSTNNHLNDEANITPNKIFDAVLKLH